MKDYHKISLIQPTAVNHNNIKAEKQRSNTIFLSSFIGIGNGFSGKETVM